MSDVSNIDLDQVNEKLSGKSAEEIASWAVENFGPDIAISSSFGAESACLLHVATQVMPDIRVNFIETGFLFPETIKFRDELIERCPKNRLGRSSSNLRLASLLQLLREPSHRSYAS